MKLSFFVNFICRMNEKSLEVDILAITIFFKNNNNFFKEIKIIFYV